MVSDSIGDQQTVVNVSILLRHRRRIYLKQMKAVSFTMKASILPIRLLSTVS
jgi:hypothetical protein